MMNPSSVTTTLHRSLSWSGGGGLNNSSCSKFFNHTIARQHQINQRRKMVNFECGCSSSMSSEASLSTMTNSSTTMNNSTPRYFSSKHGRREATSDSYLLKSNTVRNYSHETRQHVSRPHRVLPKAHNPQSLLLLIRNVMDSEEFTTLSGDESPKKLHKQFQSTESLSLPTESQIVINLPTFTINCIDFLRTQIHKFVNYFNTIFNKTKR